MSSSENTSPSIVNDESEEHDAPSRRPPRGSMATNARPTTITSTSKRESLLGRVLSQQNRDTVVRFFTAYGQTWVGLSPVWLMGEALTPGTKIGTQFRKGKANLVGAAEEIRAAVATSSKDIVVIVDTKLRAGMSDTGRTAEVLRAAGDHAILVVSTSIEKAQAQLRQLNTEYGPKIRKSVLNNGRDVIVVLDKALKHPLVITGVAKFAKSKGIPHADALLRLGSLALAKILKSMPDENLEGVDAVVEELDAAELERTSTSEERENAAEIGKQNGGEPPNAPRPSDPHEKTRKDTSCGVM